MSAQTTLELQAVSKIAAEAETTKDLLEMLDLDVAALAHVGGGNANNSF
jgi:hypothetical protein